jgi:Amt family ammonium transporter
LSLLIVMAFCFVGSYALYFISYYARTMRVSDEEEFMGLDLSQHGEKKH